MKENLLCPVDPENNRLALFLWLIKASKITKDILSFKYLKYH
jgi:hypothetical protein